MHNGLVYKGGMPYGPDVKRLTEAFPVPSLVEGTLIPHKDIEAVLGLKRGISRYYSVVHAWVTAQKNENGILMAWEPAQGLRVLDPAGILHHAETRIRQKSGQLSRAVKLFAWVPRERLDGTGQKRLDHQLLIANRLAQVVRDAKKELAIELAPIQSLPKRAIESPK